MTKKRTRFRSKLKAQIRDTFIAFFCLSVCAVSLWLFWKDLNLSSTRTDKDVIATISFKYKVAQRKFTDRVVWERLQQNSPLYNEDTIRTADMASARITFKDGEILEVHENSMVQIFKSADGGVRLTVEGGGIEVDTSSSQNKSALEVQMENGRSIQIENGSRLAAKSDSEGEATFQLRAGSGSITSENSSEAVALSAGETVRLENDGGIKKVPISVTSVSNDLLILNTKNSAVPVHLEWVDSLNEDERRIVVQTSRNKDFSTIESTFTPKGTNSVDITADGGTLFWRIYDEAFVEDAVSGRVRVENVLPPEPSSPQNNAIFRYFSKLPQLTFGWSGNSYADYYRLEISKNEDFLDFVVAKDVSAQSYNLNSLPEGEYFWRVRPFYSLNNAGLSDDGKVSKFRIEKRNADFVPVALSPMENGNLVYLAESLSTTFRWKSDIEDADFEVQVSDSEDFDNVLYSAESKENRLHTNFTKQTLPVGTYYWKVVQKSAGEEIYESAAKKFNVTLYVPEQNRLVYPPEDFAVHGQDLNSVVFVWKTGDELKSVISEPEFVLQVSDNADFGNVTQEIKTDLMQAQGINLPSGKYFWRVSIQNSSGEENFYTDLRSFVVLKELSDVQITVPSQNQTVLVSKAKPLEVRWNEADGADFYTVRILNPADKSVIAELPTVRGNLARFNLDLYEIASKASSGQEQEQGQNPLAVECSVQPASDATEFYGITRGNITTKNFSIRAAQKIRLIAPQTDESIDGLKAKTSPVRFEWNEGIDVSEKSQFVLQKLQPQGSYKNVWTIENPAKVITLENLTEGKYRWTVNASMADGTSTSAGDFNSFVISPVPELALPVLSEPDSGLVMTVAYLKNHRSINFRWKEVKGATDYTFSLYKKSGGKLTHVMTQKTGRATSVRFRDLKLLDNGEFEWQVTAYSLDKNGNELQHSRAATGGFKIDISLPGKIQTKNPGEIFVE